jgi:nicotinamidase-related amidase
MLDKQECVLIIIDVQEKLVNALAKDTVVQKTAALVKAAKIMGIPTIVTEQYPKGLGQTMAAVKETFDSNTTIIEKSSFSAAKETGFLEKLNTYNKKQVVICGIETHICVHQATADLLTAGYDVYVAQDACASRNKYEFKQGIERMRDNGAKISCVEIILFEWLRSSKDIHFKEIQALIK